MNLYINDLSYNPQNTSPIEPLLKDFIDVCERTQKYSFERLIVPEDYRNKEITQGLSFAAYFYTIHNSNTGHLILDRIKSLMANQFYSTSNIANQEMFWVEWNNISSDFLTQAHNHTAPVISFKTHPDFEHHRINVSKVELDNNTNTINTDAAINNLSDLTHFATHNAFLNSKQQEQLLLKARWNALQTPFRMIVRMQQYLVDIKYDEITNNINDNQKISIYRSVGKYIAEMNGWQENNSLSKKNNRAIFKALNQSAYLAIDTMHGTFELHDRNGKHKGEYNFKGEKVDDADTAGNHDIEL
ncbi:hypothetical protein DR864_02570 [Runella rosea]|uniref:Uncharacterized protein n=1 Tax=Runella rosea TaxID=2259595 RepID=A0A344TDH0_9BACT|nr:hypothetical protein [Runella rosea]AXE16691.1 hypothetical protein DR864_02570 [Runella rosea]